MRGVFTVDEVRAAEAALLARTPPGALMQRAATGLAVHCAAAARRRVRRAASRCSSEPATTAATRCSPVPRSRRRGARVTAVLLEPGARRTPDGLAALASRRVAGSAELPGRACDLVIDGILGIGGRGALRPDAARTGALRSTTSCTVAVDLPSGVDADTGRGAPAPPSVPT